MEHPPPTPNQKQVILDSLKEALRPLVIVWDRQAKNMVEVTAQNSRTEGAVSRAVSLIKVAGWLFVVGMLVGGAVISFVLDEDREDRRDERRYELQQREAARDAVLQAVRLYGHKLDDMAVIAPCPEASKPSRRAVRSRR